LKIPRHALAGLVAALLVAGASSALLFWLPNLVARRVAAQIEARTGLSTRADGVSFGPGSVRLKQLMVGGAAGEVTVRATGLTVAGSPWRLALQGSRAVSALEIDGLDVRFPVTSPGARALLEQIARRGEGTADDGERDGAGGRSERAVRIRRFSLLLTDRYGELVRVQGGSLALDAERARVEVERTSLGQQPGGQLALQRLVVEAKRGDAGFQFQQGGVADARLRLPAPVVSAESGEAAPDAATAVPRSSQRLLEVVRAVLPGQVEAEGASPQHAGGTTSAPTTLAAGPVARVLARLADDASFSLDNATVYDRPEAPPLLQKLRASLKVQADHVLLFSGAGAAQTGGAVSWDLVVRPEQLRADGEVALRALPLNLLAPVLPRIPWYRPEDARVDASLQIKTAPEQGVSFSGEGSLRGGAIESERIAPTPVRGIDIALRGRGRLLPVQHRLEIAEAELSLGRATVTMAGNAEWTPDHYVFDIDARLRPTPCTDVVQSVPPDVLGDMALATWRGKLSGEFRLRLDSRQLALAELKVDPKDQCQFETVPVMADLRRFGQPFVHSVLEPDDSVFEMTTGPGTPAWTDIEDISPLMVHAVVAHEDAGFFSHKGFSMRHIREALVRNLEEGRYVVGASTITMQLVKNVFLHREKTLARKIQEVLLTWWLERVMEKRDIIELYLNVIEYGPGVYGIRNATRHYFSREPSELSPAEAVYLSTILPNPKRYHQHLVRGGLTAGWTEVMRKMLLRLGERGSYAPETVEYGLHELEDFHFAPRGTAVGPREFPSVVAPLPYMEGGGGLDAPWAMDDSPFDQAADRFDDGLDEPRSAPTPASPPQPTSRAFPRSP
jgi:hypothetical protein